jgi:hypothetical protein
MNTRMNTDRAGFAAHPRFTPTLLPAATPHFLPVEEELEQLKNRLLREALARANSLDTSVWLRRAANDAAALAWLTPYPLLLLPGLFEEKARLARKSACRQASIRKRSSELLSLTE